ncbi:hypothetical protein RRG08_060053 [Elysia crispata]|uniref:Band 7 domain-containing protein n=1 Tax=Elysia crispata TaxID=231223 RepID=A0AAE0Y1L0_9GAST|nr:hypothetical protein RRG08_060053 [Elysia crispata]
MGFETCGPNEVLIVSGVGHSRPKFKCGGWVFVWPKLQQVQRLSLNLMTLSIETLDACTQQGITVSVKAVAQVRIVSSNQELLKIASENFLGKSEEEIGSTIKATLESLQKTIISTMNLEDVYFDSDKKFFKTMYEEGSSELINMGVQIVSYKVVDVMDKKGHLEALIKKKMEDKTKEVASSAE